MIILCIDGLEYEYVKEFELKNLMQDSFGKTNISIFSEPRTIVLWSSFLSGRNTEKEVLSLKNIWDFKLKPEETFLSSFEKWIAIDLPTISYKQELHQKEREAMKLFFDNKITLEEYDKIAFENYKIVKQEFLEALNKDYDLLAVYISLADVVGHLSFGLKTKMKIIYKELDNLAKTAREKDELVLIISDHGMKPVGRFGDHSEYGFWSLSKKIELPDTTITKFRKYIEQRFEI